VLNADVPVFNEDVLKEDELFDEVADAVQPSTTIPPTSNPSASPEATKTEVSTREPLCSNMLTVQGCKVHSSMLRLPAP
jgi:hypothetical protein